VQLGHAGQQQPDTLLLPVTAVTPHSWSCRWCRSTPCG
jgi:hypothetical protein